MVDINYKIIITAIVSLTIIELVLILCNHDTEAFNYAMIATIGLMAGVVIPMPKINNKRGVLIW